jgi:hypothetical protein
MSASKLPDTSQKRGTLVARPMVRADAHESVGTQETILGQEKVLAEIAHELGNFFHKLYYWSDYLKEKPGRSSEDSTAAQMLESTIRNLEGFLKVSLDYFHPTQLSFTRMPVTDLLDGVLFQVRQHLNGTPISVPADQSERGRLRKAAVMVDPGHLSRAFEVAVRHLTQRLGTESTVRLGRVPAGIAGGSRSDFTSKSLMRPRRSSAPRRPEWSGPWRRRSWHCTAASSWNRRKHTAGKTS